MPNEIALAPNENESLADDSVPTLWRVAQRIGSTMVVPKTLRGRPEEVFAVLLLGRDLGLPTTVALARIYVIEGVVTMSAELLAARALAAGNRIEFIDYSVDKVTLRGTRLDGASLDVSWTMTDANRAGLVKATGAWKNYPRQMLLARARGELVRALFPEAALGLYASEEISNEVTPREAATISTARQVDVTTGEILDVDSEEVEAAGAEPELEDDEGPEDNADRDWRAAAQSLEATRAAAREAAAKADK